MAYVYGGILVFSTLVSTVLQHNGQLRVCDLNCRTRQSIIISLYRKLINLSSYQVKEANLGKIINLISNDLITAEMRLIILMFSLCFPINIIISSVIIVIRLSWVGLISIVVMLAYIYFQKVIGKKQQGYLRNKAQMND